MIRYYLNQEPILNNIMTFQLGNPDQKNHVISEIDKMVIKKTDGSGGYGMLMGNKASDQEIDSYLTEVNKNPKNYIAQPILIMIREVIAFIITSLINKTRVMKIVLIIIMILIIVLIHVVTVSGTFKIRSIRIVIIKSK